jgi:hypothetical protein
MHRELANPVHSVRKRSQAPCRCLLAYTALIAATTPELSGDARGKILSTLTSGLDVGNEISIQTDER